MNLEFPKFTEIFRRIIKRNKSGNLGGSNKIDEELIQKIYPRLYMPKNEDIIYHYCSPETFRIITSSRTLRFSDIFAMNDFNEMHWGYHIFEIAAGNLMSKIPKDFFDKIDLIISSSGMHVLPTVCCFSFDGDVLSQWRAYGNDGRGFAIGFSASMLKNLPVRSLKILYNKDEQVNEVTRWLEMLFLAEKSNGFTYGNDFESHVRTTVIDLCAMKNPGFREEMEVRYVHALNFKHERNKMSLFSGGGTSWGRTVEGKEIQFRMKDSTPVAYIDFDFSNNKSENPIKSVVLGPKKTTAS